MSTATDLLLIRAGVTYRQVDHWVRQGWVEPRFWRKGGDRADEGKSGYVRDFTDHEQQVIIAMGRLTGAGIRAEVAARVARSMVDQGHWTVRLERGVVITLEDGTTEQIVSKA